MDTLGTLLPCSTDHHAGTVHHVEAFERARYLALTGGHGVITGGIGVGKTWLLNQLAPQVRREGVSVISLNLNGVSAAEIPALFASRLGLGVSHQAPEFEVWARLQDYAQSFQAVRRPLAFFIDHLERARESVLVPLDRLIQGFAGQTAWLMASRTPLTDRWSDYYRQQSWLKIHLQNLNHAESAVVLDEATRDSLHGVTFSKDAYQAAFTLSSGQTRKLKKLAELAALAAAADGVNEVDADFLNALSRELIAR